MQASLEGKLTLVLVFASKAIGFFQEKLSVGYIEICHNNSALLAKTNTGASKPGGRACTGIGFCKQSYWLSQEDELALVLVFERKASSK